MWICSVKIRMGMISPLASSRTWNILSNSSQRNLGVLRGVFKGFGCPKRHPDAQLAKTMKHRLLRRRDQGLLLPLPQGILLLHQRGLTIVYTLSRLQGEVGLVVTGIVSRSVFWPVGRRGGRTSYWGGGVWPLWHPSCRGKFALDHKLLGTTRDDPTDPVDVPVVSTPLQTASTSTAPAASVYARLGPPREGSGDHTVPPHPDLSRSWRESWEAQFSRPLEFVPIIHALSSAKIFSTTSRFPARGRVRI